MALTPIFWARVWKNHGSRGLLLALALSFVVSIIFYVLYYFAIPEMFDLSGIVEVFLGYLMMIIVLVLFFVLYWKFVVKKK
jgi:zinc transporter ZupT